MTVIAYDGVTLAADKLACSGNTKSTITKIFKFKNNLIGIAGCMSGGMELMAWYMKGAIPIEFPDSNRDSDSRATMIVINHQSVSVYETSPYPFHPEGKCAIGSGEESVLVAMECGLDAVSAVLMTSKFNSGCGSGVDYLVLDDVITKPSRKSKRKK